ncbi:MAG: hypothetical protein LC754_04530 [Acidobacteria bacterium]|nr:hypothetical protein [Acidobacteriota bacterium]
MSKNVRRTLVGICCQAALIFFAAGVARAQSLDARLSVVSVAPARVHVEGVRRPGATRWSFRATRESGVVRVFVRHGGRVGVQR